MPVVQIILSENWQALSHEQYFSNHRFSNICQYTCHECNNTYHRTIKVKSADVKSSTYIDFNVDNNDKDHKFEVGDHLRMSNYKNIFAKSYTQNWSEELCIIEKVKNTAPST